MSSSIPQITRYYEHQIGLFFKLHNCQKAFARTYVTHPINYYPDHSICTFHTLVSQADLNLKKTRFVFTDRPHGQECAVWYSARKSRQYCITKLPPVLRGDYKCTFCPAAGLIVKPSREQVSWDVLKGGNIFSNIKLYFVPYQIGRNCYEAHICQHAQK